MTRIAFPLAMLALVVGIAPSFASTFSGVHQVSVFQTCRNSSCTSAIDVLTGTGSNSLQGASEITATVTEDSFYTKAAFQPGPMVINSLSDGSQISGVLEVAWVLGIASPAWQLTGIVHFTGGTGVYSQFAEIENVLGTGNFTGDTSAEGTLAFAPTVASWLGRIE